MINSPWQADDDADNQSGDKQRADQIHRKHDYNRRYNRDKQVVCSRPYACRPRKAFVKGDGEYFIVKKNKNDWKTTSSFLIEYESQV